MKQAGRGGLPAPEILVHDMRATKPAVERLVDGSIEPALAHKQTVVRDPHRAGEVGLPGGLLAFEGEPSWQKVGDEGQRFRRQLVEQGEERPVAHEAGALAGLAARVELA